MEIEREWKQGQAWRGKEPHRDNHDDYLIVSSAVATSYMCLSELRYAEIQNTHWILKT